jgi:lactate dehydrogenase-like 2-hydroxyacid dehydrogenase
LKPKILITRPLPETVLHAARDRFDVTLRNRTEVLTPDELRAALRDYDAVLPTLGDRFQADVFADVPAPRAKLLANFGVGYNHIDAEAAKAAGILVTARRLGEGERLLRSGGWEGWHPVQMLGTHVTGKRLGVIGLGRIGKAIAKRCHYGFDMEVVFYNRSPVADAGVPARQVDMAQAMAADFVVVAVPGGKATHHLIDAGALSHMKKTGILVNISRGDVVDEHALIDALQQGRIAGAGLDVYEFEPKVPVALMAMENVTLLPHLGTACLEVRENMGMMAVANLVAWAEGKAPPNLVNP